MKLKKNFKISSFFSLLFLLLLTFISLFIFIISIKPVKINFLNYFDRESLIFKEVDIKEIGDVYLSFNKVTKNFEVLVENIIIDRSFFPNILIGIDPTFNKNFFDFSLKIFDGDIEISSKNRNNFKNDLSPLKYFEDLLLKFKRFKDIQVANTKLKLVINEKNIKNYVVDLNLYKDRFKFSISEENLSENFLSVDYLKEEETRSLSLEFEKFQFDLVKYFFNLDSISLNKLSLTGSSELKIKKNNSIENIFFNMSLDGNFTYLTFDGLEIINFKDSKIFGEKNQNNIDVSLDFNHFESNIKTVLRFNMEEKNLSKIFFELDKITVQKILEVWPAKFKDSVYDWMKVNSNGKIFDVSINSNIFNKNGDLDINGVNGSFDFNDTEIRYMESMPLVNEISGKAKVQNNKIIFDIFTGKSKKLNISGGTVELNSLDTDVEKAEINLEIFSENQFVVNYLDISPIRKDSFKKLREIEGENSIKLGLKFPLIVDLPVEDILYSADVSISNSKFNNLFKDYSLDNFSLDININSEKINYTGKGYLLGSLVNFQGKQLKRNNKYEEEINGTYDLQPSFINSIFPNNSINYNSTLEVSFVIVENDEGLAKFEGISDLSNLSLDSEFLGSNLDFDNGKLRFLIRPYDNSYSGFIDIKTKNIEIEINSLFVAERILEVDVRQFKTPLQDFSINYKNDKFIVTGKRFCLDKIDIFENSNFDQKDLNLEFNVSELIISDMTFYNPEILIKKQYGVFDRMLVSLKGKDDFHKINIDDEENKKKFTLESNYLPGLLKIFDHDLNINRGSIKIEGNKPYETDEYQGVIVGKNIVFYDTPFLANFFSLFSLEGFAQKLKDGGIIFSELKADYKLSNQKLKIVDSLLKGSELGIQFDSVIGLEDDYFLMNGSIIPAYTINTLLTKFPIVGEIITAGSPEDGLIGANFRVEKNEGEYEVFYNPISVFVPNIIKNFLGD